MGDDRGKLRHRLAPFAGDPGARHMDAQTGRGEMRELRLGQPVDRRNDQTDPCGRDLDPVVAGVFDRDGIHNGLPAVGWVERKAKPIIDRAVRTGP